MITLDINKRGQKNKTDFIYESLKNQICEGKIFKGNKLPSKRELSQHLHVSVITVENAYKMLESEGYIEAKDRSGFYVTDIDFLKFQQKHTSAKSQITYLPEETVNSSFFWTFDNTEHIEGISKIMRKILMQKKDIFEKISSSEGCAVLRNAISDYLLRFRGLVANPENIIIGAGSEYLYRICVQLLGYQKTIGIEKPSYKKIEQIYRSLNMKISYLEMGTDGIKTVALKDTDADYIHVTPYHSYPSGVTASVKKRYEYLEWAEKRKSYIIEDDFDSEVDFFYKPIDTLYQIDKNGRVIYVNTFTKSIAPGFRVAYMVLPDSLKTEYRQKLGFYSCPVPVFIQYVLASYIEDGLFERHLAKMRRKNNKAFLNISYK